MTDLSQPTAAKREGGLFPRMMVVTCLLTLGFSGVVWRLYDLQLRRGPQLAAKAAAKFSEIRALPAQRGSIKDFADRYLAYDEEVFELSTNRVHLHELTTVKPCLARVRGVSVRELGREMSQGQIFKAYHEHVARALAAKLERPYDEMLARVRSGEQIEVLAQNLSEEQGNEWREYLKSQSIKGVYIKPTVRRRYPTENRLALIVGGLESGKGGVRGVEKTYEETLRGKPGSVSVEHDKYGRELPLYRGEMVEPKHGRDVHLTIDMPLQDAIDHIVAQADLTWSPNKIMAVVTEVDTGSILAMSFRPDHDRAQDPKKLAQTNWKNLAIYEPYEPGSTFKVVAFTAAIDQRKLSPDQVIDCEWGRYTDPVLGGTLTDVSRLGSVTAREVLAKSSNIGTYKVFKRVGQETFLDYVKRFGFGQRTGIELTGESQGYINEKNWSKTTYSRFPIGYEVNVTPIQMAMAYGALANGGLLMKPRLVDRVVSDGGRKVETIPPKVVAQVCSGKTSAIMRELMKEVVKEGTGSRARLEGVEVAGKTGTTRRFDPNYVWRDERGRLHKGGYPKGQWITSFAGFAPADKPKIACVVVLDHPKSPDPDAIGGGKVAAPIFAEIVAETLKHLSVRPQRSLAMEGGLE